MRRAGFDTDAGALLMAAACVAAALLLYVMTLLLLDPSDDDDLQGRIAAPVGYRAAAAGSIAVDAVGTLT